MTGTPPEGQDWFDKAGQDLEMARRAMDPKKPLPAMACYHAQQCVEKYLKGYLVACGIRFRFVHDLVYLTQLCTETEAGFETLMSAAEVLGEYGTTMRYPVEEAEDEPDNEDAHEAIRLTEIVAAYVLKQLGVQKEPPESP